MTASTRRRLARLELARNPAPLTARVVVVWEDEPAPADLGPHDRYIRIVVGEAVPRDAPDRTNYDLSENELTA